MQLLPISAQDYLNPDDTEHVRHNGLFLGAPTRAGAQQGWVDWTPNHFSEVPQLLRDRHIASEVAISRCSPMDEHGFFSLSLCPAYLMAAVAMAREVEAWSRAGEGERARSLAATYLVRHPDGRRARSVRRFGGVE
mgnify:CR=1 FL=1